MRVEAPPTWVRCLLFGTILLVSIYPLHSFRNYRNVNETARVYLVQAAVREQVLHIDSGIAEYGDVHDKAEHDGHFYCDKPIGLSLAAVPVYGLMYGFERAVGRSWTLQETRYLLALLCVTLPSLWLAYLLYGFWSRLTSDPWLAGFSVLAYGLGTIACVYSTQFMGHQLSALLVFWHFVRSRKFDESAPASGLFACGLLSGFGAITQYFSSFAHLIIALSYLLRVRPIRNAGFYVAGGAIAIAPLLIYNTICFGGPLEMAYGYEADPQFRVQHDTGFFGVTFPTWEAFSGLLFSARKGLFFLSPFLLLGLLGLPLAAARRTTRRDAVVMGLGVLAIGWLALSVLNWRAGWTVGPRHTVDMLPFLMTGVVLAVHRFPVLRPYYLVSAIAGMIFIVPTTLALPGFEVNLENPLLSQTAFLLGQGYVSPNLGTSIGLPATLSLLVPGGLALFTTAVILRGAAKGEHRPQMSHLSGAALLGVLLVSMVVLGRSDPLSVRLYNQGVLLEQVDQEHAAVERLERALEETPVPQMARRVTLRLLSIYERTRNLPAALGAVERWIEIDPDDPDARHALSQLRKMQTGRSSTEDRP